MSKYPGVVPIFNERGRVCAGVRPGGILQKDVNSSKHFLRKPPAIALDMVVLDAAEQAGATVAEVTDQDTGHVYTASIADIRAHGFRVDRGFGLQVALPIGAWGCDGAPAQPVKLKHAPAPAAQQMSMFGAS